MHHPNPSDHERHDASLIAGHAAGDLADVERARADTLIAACAECSELRRDLVAIAAATRAAPAPATLTRDLRLAPEQAERLRRGSWLRAFLRPFGAAGSPVRPMAAAFTSLGVVGLVVGMTMSSALPQPAGDASGTAVQREDFAAAASPAAGAPDPFEAGDGVVQVSGSGNGMYLATATTPLVRSAADAARSAAPEATTSRTAAALGYREQDTKTETTAQAPRAPAAPSARTLAEPPSPLIAGSLAMLGIGLLLFGLRIASRRVH